MTLQGITLRVAIGTLILQAPRSPGQTPAARPKFEVASITLDRGCENYRWDAGTGLSPDRLRMECVTLEKLLQGAYGLFSNGVDVNPQQLQIAGGPDWIHSDRYDVAARTESGAGFAQMAGPMLQALLENRFKLKVHRETREIPVYALTVAKSGLKLKEESCIPLDLNHLPPPPAPGQPVPNFCGGTNMRNAGTTVTLDAHGISMAEFCHILNFNFQLDRTAIDKTGVAGKFDFHLEFAPDETTRGFPGRGGDAGNPANAGNPAPPAEPAGPTIFAALQEQLGLTLVPERGPVEFLVIDHVEKPAGN